MAYKSQIEAAKNHLGVELEEWLERVESIVAQPDWLEFSQLIPIEIGSIGADGIGLTVAQESQHVLKLRDEKGRCRSELRAIEGMAADNRAPHMQSAFGYVLEDDRDCYLTFQRPSHPLGLCDVWPNLESANVRMPVPTLIKPPRLVLRMYQRTHVTLSRGKKYMQVF